MVSALIDRLIEVPRIRPQTEMDTVQSPCRGVIVISIRAFLLLLLIELDRALMHSRVDSIQDAKGPFDKSVACPWIDRMASIRRRWWWRCRVG